MKYFTPERYLRLGDRSSKQVFLAAHEDWERAVEAYGTHLRQIRSHLPSPLRRLIESVSLHDARVLGIWQGAASRFTITLLPESDPSRLVVLAYSLVEPPRIERAALPEGSRSQPTAWLYDELEVEDGARNSGRVTYLHDILLSNGWEMHLRFRSITITRPVPLLPPPEEDSFAPATVSRSA